MKVRKYLIVTGKGDMRVVTRRPYSLRHDEVAFPIEVTVPDTWARIYDKVEVTMPEPSQEAALSVGEAIVDSAAEKGQGDGEDA